MFVEGSIGPADWEILRALSADNTQPSTRAPSTQCDLDIISALEGLEDEDVDVCEMFTAVTPSSAGRDSSDARGAHNSPASCTTTTAASTDRTCSSSMNSEHKIKSQKIRVARAKPARPQDPKAAHATNTPHTSCPLSEAALRLPLREFRETLSNLCPADRAVARLARRSLQNRNNSSTMRQRIRERLNSLGGAAERQQVAVLAMVEKHARVHFPSGPSLDRFLVDIYDRWREATMQAPQ